MQWVALFARAALAAAGFAGIAGGALGGCAHRGDDTIDLTFDPCAVAPRPDAGTPAQLAGITDALALWQLMPDQTVPLEVRFEDAAPSFFGVYDDEAGIVFVNRRITEPHALSVVIAHELGHAFGLPHVDGRPSLMNPANSQTEPTAEDRAALVALWGTCPH